MGKATTQFFDKGGLLKANDRPVVPFKVPGLGKSLRLRAPSMADILRSSSIEDEGEQVRELCRLGIVGEDGEPLLTAEEAGELFKQWSPRAVNAVAQKMREIAGLNVTQEEAEGN